MKQRNCTEHPSLQIYTRCKEEQRHPFLDAIYYFRSTSERSNARLIVSFTYNTYCNFFDISRFTWMERTACCENTEGLEVKLSILGFTLVFAMIAFTVVDLDHTFTFLQILFQIVVILSLRR